MRKNSITEPKFGKIFAVRFLISLIIISVLATYLLYRFDDYVWIHSRTIVDELQQQIAKTTRMLSEETPGSIMYNRYMDELKVSMADYQTINDSYVEVTIGGETITVGDTAVFYNYGENVTVSDSVLIYDVYDENDLVSNWYIIEDISYLDPLKEIVDEKKQIEKENEIGMDPLFEDDDHIGELDKFRDYCLISAYVNRETHTFIPGVVKVRYMGKEYRIDCTPSDTKGFEKIDVDQKDGGNLWINYRATPDLSSDDFVFYLVPDPILEADVLNAEEFAAISKEGLDWYIGFAQPRYYSLPVFELAPITSEVITAASVFLAVVVAFILAKIRYQKDKTVWKIFEYRVKTSEAMAHDLKTPLSTTMFYLENLEESADDPEKVREYARNINEKIVKMDQMIGDILMLSRSESGKISLAKEEVSLRDLLGDCLKEFPSMETEISGDDVVLTTDRKVLGQVITNLFSNCDRYRLEGSVVSVDIGSDVLIVCNPTDRTYDDVESLKKPFVKGEDSRGSKGAGLGLAIAENNLAILGYKLELSSESGKFKVRIKFKP